MPATYDPALTSALDWVRFLSGDVDVANAKLDDQELTALITQHTQYLGHGEWVSYYAAAAALDVLAARWRVATNGTTSERVGTLALSYGGEVGNLASRAKELREQGAALKLPRPRVFECM